MNIIEEFFKNRVSFVLDRTQPRGVCTRYVSKKVFKPEVFNYNFLKRMQHFITICSVKKKKKNENGSVCYFDICFCQENGENIHCVFYLSLYSTIEPNDFFSLLNSEINRRMDSFSYTFPTQPFKLSLSICVHMGLLPFELRSGEECEEESKEEPIINIEKSFKSDECVICLTNLPNVLFCNCGHLCICEQCGKMKSLNICPVCKTENTIKRTI